MEGAGNQQERLDGYIAGYVDGEGCFAISVQRNPTTVVGHQLVPEFRVSQNGDRAQVLHLIRERLGCGYIKANGRKDRALVLVVRNRKDLLERVIPFFEANPLLSTKHQEFERFARIVRSMQDQAHRTREGFRELLVEAMNMNGAGQYRQIRWLNVIGPESSETTRQTGSVPKI